MNGHYLHILGKSMSLVGVLHENAQRFWRKLISLMSMLPGYKYEVTYFASKKYIYCKFENFREGFIFAKLRKCEVL